jgi:hypothetical protein
MTDQPEKMSETEDVDADFEAHRLAGSPERTADTTDVKSNTEDVADFEGHRFSGPEKIAKYGDITDVKSNTEDEGPDFEGHRFSGPEKIAKLS